MYFLVGFLNYVLFRTFPADVSQIEALHKAFNARSEGTRVSHTTHKLAMVKFQLLHFV